MESKTLRNITITSFGIALVAYGLGTYREKKNKQVNIINVVKNNLERVENLPRSSKINYIDLVNGGIIKEEPAMIKEDKGPIQVSNGKREYIKLR